MDRKIVFVFLFVSGSKLQLFKSEFENAFKHKKELRCTHRIPSPFYKFVYEDNIIISNTFVLNYEIFHFSLLHKIALSKKEIIHKIVICKNYINNQGYHNY